MNNSLHDSVSGFHLDLHIPGFKVESDLEFQVLNNWSEDLHPGLLERSEAMRGDRHFTKLWTPSLQTNGGKTKEKSRMELNS